MSVPPQPGYVAVTSIEPPVQITNNTNGAQSPAPSPAAFAHGATGERTFTADEIAAARKQEKDKLYPEITALKEQMAQAQKTMEALQAQRQTELDEVARKQQEKEAAITAKKEDEMSAKALLEQRLAETQKDFQDKLNKIESEREVERALAAK